MRKRSGIRDRNSYVLPEPKENMEKYIYNGVHTLTLSEKAAIAAFLHKHLESYTDPEPDIRKAIDYALEVNGKLGGMVIVLTNGDTIIGAAVVNKTGMDGYIPENILVYIATHAHFRGQGLGKRLMETTIEYTNGAIALHVEPDNPARFLYQKYGFSSKYLEMRLQK